MQFTTIAVDTAKLVFEVVVSDGHRVIENHRLNRAEFQAFIVHQPPSRFVMEACGGSHHWARLMLAHGHSVRLLPVPYVRAYRRRNKTDRADQRPAGFAPRVWGHSSAGRACCAETNGDGD